MQGMKGRRPGSPESSGQTILVVEDDPSIALGLRINLEKEGYVVVTADDGERGLALARDESPDLIVLDVMLPKLNGFEVLDTLRREGRTMPIIVLSARSAEMDNVTGLELGAEDYVAKPFSLAELLARVRAALRRGHPPRRADALVRRLHDRSVGAPGASRRGSGRDDGHRVRHSLVPAVCARGPRPLAGDHRARGGGPNHHGTPRTVDNFMQQLRAKIEADPHAPRYLHTVRGVGYRFEG
ncbi:MAG: response regulator transcription factor [Polyangiaceae bacterium]